MEQERDSRGEATNARSAKKGAEVNRLPGAEPEVEEESAEAMDSDVPQPPDASKTTEGQPS